MPRSMCSRWDGLQDDKSSTMAGLHKRFFHPASRLSFQTGTFPAQLLYESSRALPPVASGRSPAFNISTAIPRGPDAIGFLLRLEHGIENGGIDDSRHDCGPDVHVSDLAPRIRSKTAFTSG